MLTLKTFCFLKVTSSNLPFEDLPDELKVQLEKMKKYNGTFLGEEDEVGKKSVMSVQYRGDRKWIFQINHIWSRCSQKNCSIRDRSYRRLKECRVTKQGIVQLHIVENKETQLSLQEWKGFVNFGPRLPLEENMRIFYNEDLAKTVLTIDKSDPGTITFTTILPGKFIKTEYIYRNRFKMCQSGNMRVLSMMSSVWITQGS